MMTLEQIRDLRRRYPNSEIAKRMEDTFVDNLNRLAKEADIAFGGVTVRPNAFNDVTQKEFDFMKEAEVSYKPVRVAEVSHKSDGARLRDSTIYLLCAMRGHPYYNYPHILAAQRRLERLGWIVKSPVDMDRERGFDAMKLPADTDWSKWPKGLDQRSTVDHCLSTITHDVSAVYVATNEIELGPGGQAELAVARWLGLKEYHAERGDVPTICGQPVTLLGICGKAGSGKDTMRAYVEEAIFDSWNKFSVDRYSFADPMRKIAINVFGFTEDQLLDPRLKETTDSFWDVTPRKFMQLLGTDMFRNHLRDDVWLKQAERHLDGLSGDIVTIIADARFENEADWIKKNGGVLLKIEGRESSTTSLADKVHPSELDIGKMNPDFTFKNTGPLQDMKRFAAGIAELMRQGRREAPCGLGVKA